MSKIRLHGSSSGHTEVAPAAAAGNNTVTLPNSAGTLLLNNGSAASLTQIPAANIVGLATAGFERSGGIGITEFDSWYLTSNVTSDGDITANLSRQNKLGSASPLGTGMSQSSGVFTFPSTGKWLVIVEATFTINGSDNVTVDTYVTTNNSSYTHTHRAIDGNNGSGDKHGSGTSFCFLDVTDTSQVKVKFAAASIGSGSNVTAEQSYVQTGFHFIRIGST